jgi:1,2-phenylacetyl-CoA epoxidase PaaB subunit
MGHLSGEYLYEIFARQKREDRFEHVGTISAPNVALARAYAWQTYNEQKWFEMIVAPRDSFAEVNREEAPFTLNPPVVS